MKKLLEKISLRTRLTKTEIRTSFFIIFFFITGLIAKYSKVHLDYKPIKKYNYSFEDSLFKALKNSKKNTLLENKEKRVDSEVELSDFSNKEKGLKKSNSQNLRKNSININTASAKILTKIPGIGSVIANNIILLREKKGKFSTLDELIEVKRIGPKKLTSLKNYLYLENKQVPNLWRENEQKE